MSPGDSIPGMMEPPHAVLLIHAVSTTGSFDCRWSILDPPGNKMNRMNLAYGHVFILSHKVLILFMVDFTKVTKLTYL